jgi:1-acyl-sn-glycerol-3-phosphate acyltransferase
MALYYDYQLTRRDDIGALVSRSGGVVRVRRKARNSSASTELVRGVKPEEATIVWIFPRGSGGTHEFHELLRQKARPVPDTSLEV